MIFARMVGIAIVAIAALAAYLYAPDKSRAELEILYAGDYQTVEGVRLRLRDTGPRDAPAVILLHGFGASLETWEPWARALSPDYRVIRYDLTGFGLTGPDPAEDYSTEREMAILAGLMDQLDIDSAAIIGNSIGGRLAWNFAASYPARVSRLVLVAPDGFASPGFDYDTPPDIPLMMEALPYFAPRQMLRSNLALAYARPQELSEATVTRYRDLMLAPGVRRAILERMSQTILRDPAPILARIEAPTLLLWGEKDGMIPIGNADDYLQHLPNATMVALPDLGHVPFEEDPIGSLPPLKRFLYGGGP